MHSQLNMAMGTAGYYLVRKPTQKPTQEGKGYEDILFSRTIEGRFFDYYSEKGEFSIRFFGEDGLVLKLDKKGMATPRKLTFQKMPAFEINEGNASADYLWLDKDSREGLAFFDLAGNISFWGLLKKEEI